MRTKRSSSPTFSPTYERALAKNFGVSESAFANLPKEELYIFQSTVRVVGAGPVPTTFSHRLVAQEPIRKNAGTARIVDGSTFPR
jgi:oxalate decarboxylase